MAHPVLFAKGTTVPEAWEISLLETWRKGTGVPTEYDRPTAPPSKDCTMILVVTQPLAEPRIHLAMPGGFDALEKYRQEVVLGVHDHWINPKAGKWTYTYHQRLFDYPSSSQSVDQVRYLAERLASVPFSRRAQAITWEPRFDPYSGDPPCLQRVWGRCFPDQDGRLRFDMNVYWRSRDAYKAAFMNIYALTELQRGIAEAIAEKRGEAVAVGQYVDVSDSYHIYGEDFPDFQTRFLRSLERRSFYNEVVSKSRTVRTDHPLVQSGFKQGRLALARERRGG
jgi:thymidylate synthase